MILNQVHPLMILTLICVESSWAFLATCTKKLTLKRYSFTSLFPLNMYLTVQHVSFHCPQFMRPMYIKNLMPLFSAIHVNVQSISFALFDCGRCTSFKYS